MAADEKTTVDKNGKDENAEETPKKKGGNKMILFGGIGLGAIAIGVALTIFVIKPMMSSSGEENTDGTEQAEHGDKKDSDKKHAKKKESGGHGEESAGLIYSIKDIVINPAGTGGTRFLSVSFAFEVESDWVMSELEARDAAVRDALITILSSKTVAQLTDFKQKEIIRYQIKKRLEQLIDTEELSGVYYTDFVLQ